MMKELEEKEPKPRKITRAEINARIRCGIVRTQQLFEMPHILEVLVKLKRGKEKGSLVNGIEYLLLQGFINPNRLAEQLLTNENDTMSYSSMLKCIKNLEKTYPSDVFKEIKEVGIIDNFYGEVCIYCDSHKYCHERPYKI